MKPIVCVITFALGTSTPVMISAPAATDARNRRGAGEEAPTAEDQANAVNPRAAVENMKTGKTLRNGTSRGRANIPSERKHTLETPGQEVGADQPAEPLDLKTGS